MNCPDCGGAGHIDILSPLTRNKIGEKQCEKCKGAGNQAEEVDMSVYLESIIAGQEQILAGQEQILNAARHTQLQTRSIFYRPDLHRHLVYEVKEPFKAALMKLSHPGIICKIRALWRMWQVLKAVRSLPKPTRYNVGHPNSRVLCDIRDFVFSHVYNIPFLKEFETCADALIIIYDTDFYRQFINVLAESLRAAEGWIPNGPRQPDEHYWKQ
jgi:hypothetical protein